MAIAWPSYGHQMPIAWQWHRRELAPVSPNDASWHLFLRTAKLRNCDAKNGLHHKRRRATLRG
eukprot:420990-Lingulodinium_polyedra.AAC.1